MTLSYSRSKEPEAEPTLREALAVRRVDETAVDAVIHEGWDVFGVPHGGYLTALAAQAVLEVSGVPDLFTISVHFLRKARLGPMRFTVRAVGGSRRLTTFTAVGHQGHDERPTLTAMVSVGDANTLTGPTWTDRAPRAPMDLHDVIASPGAAFSPPNIARRMRLKLDPATLGFAEGRTGPRAEIRGVADLPESDVLAALVACDLTPPAIWNALGVQGWVPTLELTAHVRQPPISGPLAVTASTREVTKGLLEEDALVHDAEGRLVVQSRQLALFSGS